MSDYNNSPFRWYYSGNTPYQIEYSGSSGDVDTSNWKFNNQTGTQ